MISVFKFRAVVSVPEMQLVSSTGNVGPAAPNPGAAIAAALASVGAADDPAALRLHNLQQEYQNLLAARKQKCTVSRSQGG